MVVWVMPHGLHLLQSWRLVRGSEGTDAICAEPWYCAGGRTRNSAVHGSQRSGLWAGAGKWLDGSGGVRPVVSGASWPSVGGGCVAASGCSFTGHGLPCTDGVQRSGVSCTAAAGGLIRGYAGAGHGLDYREFDAVPRLGFDTARIRPQQHIIGNGNSNQGNGNGGARLSGEQAMPAAGTDLLRRGLAAAPAGLAVARAVARPGTAAEGPYGGVAGGRQGQGPGGPGGAGADATPGRFGRMRRQSCTDATLQPGPQASGPSAMLVTRGQVDAHGAGGGRRQVVLSVIGKRGSVSGAPGAVGPHGVVA